MLIILGLKASFPEYDNIDSKLLKLVPPYAFKPLVHVFNLSLTKSVVAVELKISKITLIHTQDSPAVFNPNRSISVLPTSSKVFEK